MEQLIKQAQRGDKDAFVELMERNKLALLSAARAILREENDVADAMQETVLSAFQGLCTLRQPKYFKTWLTRILVNHCTTILRKRKLVQLSDFLPEDSLAQGEREPDRETALDVRTTLGEIGQSDRLILTLFYLQDMSQKEIAQVLGISENAVKQRLARSKRHFKAVYEKGVACNE